MEEFNCRLHNLESISIIHSVCTIHKIDPAICCTGGLKIVRLLCKAGKLRPDDKATMSLVLEVANPQFNQYVYNPPNFAPDAEKYVKWLKKQLTAYPSTRHVLHHIGDDFEWSQSDNRFEMLEIVMDFFDKHPEYGLKVYYSTPSKYTKAVYTEMTNRNISLTQKNDDFFPYRDSPNAFWTGYYTSKPYLKRSIREASTYLQTVKKLLSQFYFKKNLTFTDIDTTMHSLEFALAILQHHDAITGTATKKVDFDYLNILSQGYQALNRMLLPILVDQFRKDYSQMKFGTFSFESTLSINLFRRKREEERVQAQLRHIALSIYNPSKLQTRVIRFVVPGTTSILATSINNPDIDYNLICSSYFNDEVVCEIFFLAQIGTAQLKSYLWYSPTTDGDPNGSQFLANNILMPLAVSLKIGEDYSIDLFNNERLVIKNGLSIDFEYITASGSHPFSLDYGFYRSFNEEGQQKSGAYIFRPATTNLTQYGSFPNIVYVKKGTQVIEVTIKRDSLVITRLRFYNSSKDSLNNTEKNLLLSQSIEIETILNKIPINDGFGKEIVMKINRTGIQNQGIFYTNSNGLENQKRTRNTKLNSNESVAGNYYPVNSAIYIEDATTGSRVTLMNDRSQGGSSLNDGALEIMIHRRTLGDDGRGVGEAVGDEKRVQIRHWLFFSKGSFKQRSLQYDLDTQPLVYISTDTQISSSQKRENSHLRFSAPTAATNLRSNNRSDLVKSYIRIYSEKELLIRLHNMDEEQSVLLSGFFNKETATCSVLQEEILGQQPSKEQSQAEQLQLNIRITNIEEVSLTTVHERSEMLAKKLRWGGIQGANLTYSDDNFENILLRPLEQRVFMLSYTSM